MTTTRSTTVVAVKRNGQIAIAADGQVTVGDMVMKHTAKKIRTLYNDEILAGFAGSVADALTLFDRFELHLERHRGNLQRAAVELVKEWRTERALRRLEAWLIVASRDEILVLSGQGDVIRPDGDVAAIGSGGGYAQAAAHALLAHSDLSAMEIARESLRIAADICIYTNHQISALAAGEKAPGDVI